MNRRLALAAVLLSFSGCFDIDVPPPPPPVGPGTLQGTLVYAEPGRAGFKPADGATATVLASGLTVLADADGRFVLTGLTQRTGVLLLSHEVGGVHRQRVFRLETLGVGTGHDISMGEVVLSRNGAVHGQVALEGVTGGSGLGGVTVFVPGAPWSTYTADDGTYSLEGLPEGGLQVAFFRAGYAVGALDTLLGPGEEKVLPVARLSRTMEGPASVKGQVVTAAQAPASDARVRLRFLGDERPLPVDAQGRFAASSLTAGLYSFAVEREGAFSIALYNVLLPSGETDLGTLTLLDGPTTSVRLTGLGPYVAAMTDGGVGDAGVEPDGGQSNDAGSTNDAGQTNDAGSSTDAGQTVDAGQMPTAVATGPAVAAAGTQVQLSGMSSVGDFPLIYRWTQTSGTGVTLSANDSSLAHSPRFTAPAAGTIIEFSLVVEDRLGFRSAPAVVRVGIGVAPQARFTPDSGLFLGGQLIPLASTSFDDAGVALVAWDWRLVSGTTGTLITDGGPTATWQTPTVAFGSPDVIGGVTLAVTNAIGARSSTFTNFYTVRGANPNNWVLDAGPSQNVNVGPVPPQVQLSAGVTSTLVSAPQYSVAWTCPASISLIGADTLTPRFVAPTIAGPTQTVGCQVVATGQPPLDPPTLTSTMNVFLKDTAPPTIASSSVEPTRIGRFGVIVTASEALGSANLSITCTPGLSMGPNARIINKSAVVGATYYPFPEGGTCGSFLADLTDLAQVANAANNLPFGPGGAVTVQTVWSGPYESTASFDDPRPVVSTLSQLPKETLALNGLAPNSVAGFEVVATQGGSLVRFAGLDLSTRPVCDPTTCALSSTTQALGLSPNSPAGAERAHFGGAELFVATSSDGGVAPLAAKRGPTGTWSTFAGLTGTPSQWDGELRTTRFDSTLGQILIDTWNPATQSFTTTDLAATGLTAAPVVASATNYMVAATGVNRQLFARKRAADLSWSTINISAPATNVTSLRMMPMSSGVVLVGYEGGATGGLSLQRLDFGGVQNITTTAVTGYELASWGGTIFVVYGFNGDIRLKTVVPYTWSGAGGGPVDFGGPPRVGFTAPYPVVLDVNPLCEAAWPHMDFVEDALVITWQERCSPSTQWKVMARVVR